MTSEPCRPLSDKAGIFDRRSLRVTLRKDAQGKPKGRRYTFAQCRPKGRRYTRRYMDAQSSIMGERYKNAEGQRDLGAR
jgi:hypothetical protein